MSLLKIKRYNEVIMHSLELGNWKVLRVSLNLVLVIHSIPSRKATNNTDTNYPKYSSNAY